MKVKYKTLLEKSEYLLKEKASKFIAFAQGINNEEDIKKFLQDLKKEHPQANHVCYAYKIGVNKLYFRANDDGEPSNSAGTPILGQINSFELTNVIVAIVRYFGGTKLGVGGLVSAYKTAAKNAIEQNKIIERELGSELEVSVNYLEYPKLMKLIKSRNCEILSQKQLEIVEIRIHLKLSILEDIKMELSAFESVEILNEKNEL